MNRVALLAEGVDRNYLCFLLDGQPCMSPSSRRAWIEILSLVGELSGSRVALLAEGVDRNYEAVELAARVQGRPPRGGRG